VAVHVDPIKPKLKLPGIMRLKLKCVEPRSRFGFKFKLRRYAEAASAELAATRADAAASKKDAGVARQEAAEYRAAAEAAKAEAGRGWQILLATSCIIGTHFKPLSYLAFYDVASNIFQARSLYP
jgi:hypothetical protein